MGTPPDAASYGVVNTGTMVNVNSAPGIGNTNMNEGPMERSPTPRPDPGALADVGVVTVLPEETAPVIALLQRGAGYRRSRQPDGAFCYEARVDADGSPVRVVATQTFAPGQRSAGPALERLRLRYAPPVVVLLGIAGGIHPEMELGDVAVATEVIYYDQRKETPTGVLRRGDTHPVPAMVRHAVNAFFSEYGEPYRLPAIKTGDFSRVCLARPGPIASGEAVIADDDSSSRRDVLAFNDKTLAVDTEAGAFARSYHEAAAGDPNLKGWLVIRGISDLANQAKDDSYHATASRHAVLVFEKLLPYLKVTA